MQSALQMLPFTWVRARSDKLKHISHWCRQLLSIPGFCSNLTMIGVQYFWITHSASKNQKLSIKMDGDTNSWLKVPSWFNSVQNYTVTSLFKNGTAMSEINFNYLEDECTISTCKFKSTFVKISLNLNLMLNFKIKPTKNVWIVLW